MTKRRPTTDVDERHPMVGPRPISPPAEPEDLAGERLTEHQTHGLLLLDAPAEDESGRPVFAVRLDDGKPACGSRRPGRPGRCESTARMLSGRCRNHGGLSPRGAAHPSFRDGTRSKYMPPPRLLRDYERLLADPEVTDHRSSVAVLDSMVQAVFDDFDSVVPPELWEKLAKALRRREVAQEAGDRQRFREADAEIVLMIRRGADQASRERHLVSLLDARRKHADAETRRIRSEGLTYSLEEVSAFYVALGAAVRKFVHDREVRDAIINELTAISGATPEEAEKSPLALLPSTPQRRR